MIKISFLVNRETANFNIINKELFYCDRLWKEWIRVLPKDEEFIRKVLNSRNKIPKQILQAFEFKDKDLEEYNSCLNDKDVADKVIIDCKLKGWRVISYEEK